MNKFTLSLIVLVSAFWFSTAASNADPRATNFRVGLTVSELEPTATQFVDFKGAPLADLTARQGFFKSLGSTEVWARMSTRKHKTVGALPFQLTLDDAAMRAKAAQALDLEFYPELGFFGLYGDVTCQPPPDFSEYSDIQLSVPWGSLTLDQMADAIRIYARETAHAFLDSGIQIKYWKLGNEVNYGMAGITPAPLPIQTTCDTFAQIAGLQKRTDPPGTGWYQAPSRVDPVVGTLNLAQLISMPEAQSIEYLQLHVWPYMARLFNAAMTGIREVQPDAKFGTHLAFTSPTFIFAFYDTMLKANVPFDTLGISFYPTSAGAPSVAQFKATVLEFQNSRKIPIYVEEIAFANHAIANSQAPFYGWDQPNGQYKISAADQAHFLSNFVGWAYENGLAGIKYYGADAAVSDLWLDLSLFELSSDGTALPLEGLKSFQDGIINSFENAKQFQ